MSLRARAGLLIASGLLVFSVSACSTSASQDPQDIARQNVCAALGNLASGLLQLQGVDIAAIGPENLAPQINRILTSWGTLQTTLTAFAASSPEAPDAAAIEAVRTTGLALEASLQAIDKEAPTTEQVDAAKASAQEFATAYQDAFGELECGPAVPAE
jgi:hypothetical protein